MRIRFFHVALFLLILIACRQSSSKHESTTSANVSAQVQKPTSSVLSNVQTAVASEHNVLPEVEATGSVEYDPRTQVTLSARCSGRIDRLYVRYNYQSVEQGDRIMDIYSPDLLALQNEYLSVLNASDTSGMLAQVTREKLLQYGMVKELIRELESTRKAINPVPIIAITQGHIHDIGSSNPDKKSSSSTESMNGMPSPPSTGAAEWKSNSSQQASPTSELNLKEGMYVQRGQPLFSIYSSDKVWIILNIPQQSASIVHVGTQLDLRIESDTVRCTHASIAYLEPITTHGISTTRARVYLDAKQAASMKIGTLVSASIKTNSIRAIFVPRTAVVVLGKNGVVFVKENDSYHIRTVETGLHSDDLIEIKKGLTVNEEFALNAQYLVDSESFLKENDEH